MQKNSKSDHLIILQEATLRNYLEAFRCKPNASQWKYFITVLIDGVSALRRQQNAIGDVAKSGSGGNDQWLSRFLISSLVSSRIGKDPLPVVCTAGATDGRPIP